MKEADIMTYPQKAAEEIKKLYPCRIELHAHTSPASTCADLTVKEVLDTFKADGYEGIAVTNHLYTSDKMSLEEYANFYRSELYQVLEYGDKIGMKVYVGAELRFKSQNNNDYLFYGYNPDDMLYICQLLNGTLEEFVRSYKTDDMFLAQAHPFRKGMILMDTDLLDGIEAFNLHPNHNSRVAVAARYANEHGKIKLMGTDFHHPDHDNLCATRVQTLPQNTQELIAVLKSQDYIFEIGDKIMI